MVCLIPQHNLHASAQAVTSSHILFSTSIIEFKVQIRPCLYHSLMTLPLNPSMYSSPCCLYSLWLVIISRTQVVGKCMASLYPIRVTMNPGSFHHLIHLKIKMYLFCYNNHVFCNRFCLFQRKISLRRGGRQHLSVGIRTGI